MPIFLSSEKYNTSEMLAHHAIDGVVMLFTAVAL